MYVHSSHISCADVLVLVHSICTYIHTLNTVMPTCMYVRMLVGILLHMYICMECVRLKIVFLFVYLLIVSTCPQSTTNSHSVVANMQKAVSLMKVHSHALCGAIASSALQREAAQKSKDTRTFNPSGSLEELQHMLVDLEREFAELAW